MTPMLPLISGERLAEVGARIIHEAQRTIHGLTDGETPEVETVIRSGSRVHILAEEADSGRLIVLGHRDRSALGRVLTASTSTGVATRAHKPIVCVPASWVPGSPRGHVVVGVDDPRHAKSLLAQAFATAASRGARLTVLHAWKLQSPYDDIIASRVDQTPWQEPVRAHLVELIHELTAQYPDVQADVSVRHQQPAAALLDSSRDADLLILGRHGHGAPFGFYLGSVARAMIWDARCPVQITPGDSSDNHHHADTASRGLASTGSER